ncbi:MAG: hypothetical protein PHU53_04835 [Thermoplasmata archaeon]|nr:hypothetical protein [Thermoplasmata archaeon]
MNKIAVALVLTIMLFMPSVALAQEDDCTEEDCEECDSCKTTNFYYVLTAAIIIFAIFFYWTNRHRIPKKPVEAEKSDDPGQREG